MKREKQKMNGWMSFREIASEVRKQAKCRKPSEVYILKRLESGAINDQWLVPDSIKPLRWIDHPTDDFGNSDWALPKRLALLWIAELVLYYTALQAEWDERKKFKATQKRLLVERFAYLKRVGYAQMDREWWAERGKPHSEAIKIRRDIDNQLLAKYSRRRYEFPGGVDVKETPAKPESAYQESTDDGRTVKLALLSRRGKFQQVDITRCLTPYGLSKLVVIHGNPVKLRVFWHPGQAREVYSVKGVSVLLKEHSNGRYFEGMLTVTQRAKLGVTD